jgi:protein-arginine kinase activator protein McsA
MMSRQLIIKIAPDETIRFPGVCTNCARPATESMKLAKRTGRTTRQVDVPLCEQCAAQLNKRSAAEERMQKLSRLLTISAGVLVFFAALLLLSGTVLWLRLPFALLLAATAAAAVTWLFRTAIGNAALPEKKAVLESAQLQAFSWRTATFKFSNDTFVERFMELNESLLLET